MQVLANHWDGGLPVQPQLIARVMGVHVVVQEFAPEISGRIERRGGYTWIRLNKTDNDKRQRFTVAHELGHFVDRKDEDFEYVEHRGPLASQGSDAGEVFANSFAAELLMPETMIHKLLQSGMEAKQMARELEVSVEAMVIRLESLGWHR